jgi:hypothetical protein
MILGEKGCSFCPSAFNQESLGATHLSPSHCLMTGTDEEEHCSAEITLPLACMHARLQE